MLRKAGNILGQVDDAVQGTIRRAVLGDDKVAGGHGTLKELAVAPFRGRPGAPDTAYKFKDDKEGIAAMLASRALQVGGVAGVTAAGKGLYDLTAAYIQQNEQTPGTVMPY